MMSEEVKELLAKIGERVIRGNIPAVIKEFDKETKQYIFTIPGEPRKLVLDPDGTIGWYNAETGPVGV